MSDRNVKNVDLRLKTTGVEVVPIRPAAYIPYEPGKMISVKDYHKRWEGAPWGARAIASFPDIDPGIMPCGSLVLLQLARPPKMIGNIHIAEEVQDNIQWRTQTALVRACGPIAFTRRDIMQPWPEGAWFAPGAFIRAPMYGGDRFKIPAEDGTEVLFVTINDLHTIAVITGDPFAIKSDW